MRVLDLFSGVGGFSLGLERAGMETIAFCEIDPWCRTVLRRHWPRVYCHHDIHTLNYYKDDEPDDCLLYDSENRHEIARGPIDLICGGFPCQPWSNIGEKSGTEDHRDLWPEMRRVIAEAGPRWVLGENVPGLDDETHMGLDRVLADLGTLGYSTTAFEIPACAVDLPHLRRRLWIVGHRNSESGRGRPGPFSGTQTGDHQARPQAGDIADRSSNASEGHRALGDCEQPRLEGHTGHDARDRRRQETNRPTTAPDIRDCWIIGWDGRARRTQPGLGLLADGVPDRVARLRALGNAVVPQIPERFGRAIMAAHYLEQPQ